MTPHDCDPIECAHPSHGPIYPPGHPMMAVAECERCGRRIERYGRFWRHAEDGSSSPCPRACPPDQVDGAVPG